MSATSHEIMPSAPTPSGPGNLTYMAEGIAHELNNSFTPILAGMEILRMNLPDEKTEQLIDLIERCVHEGTNIAQQILSLAHGIDCDYASIQLDSMVRNLRKHLRSKFPSNIVFEVKSQPGLWPIFGSFTELYQSLLQICTQAREAMAEGGTLALSVENILLDDDTSFIALGAPKSRWVMVKVKDSGAGVPEKMQERIFEPDYQPEPEASGYARGLFKVDKIIKAHGGHVHIASDTATGTTFKIYLPVAPGASREAIAEQPQPIAANRGQGEAILIVDDEPAMRFVTQQVLEAYGYRTFLASNGADALALYLQQGGEIALVFMDMNMPIMDGMAAVRALREINPEVKIIVTSGVITSAQRSKATSAGLHFLPKPYKSRDLLALVADELHQDRQAS